MIAATSTATAAPTCVVANSSDANAVSVLLGNGDGTFQPDRRGTPLAVDAFRPAGDFNGDGPPDLAVALDTDGDRQRVGAAGQR